MVCLFILILNEICFKLTTDNNLALEELDPESLDQGQRHKTQHHQQQSGLQERSTVIIPEIVIIKKQNRSTSRKAASRQHDTEAK
jgi:hypothetical protein